MKFINRMTSHLTGNTKGVVVAGYDMLKRLFADVVAGTSSTADESVAVERYKELQKSFTDDLRIRWQNYIRTVKILWGICFIVIGWSLLEQAWLTLLEGIVMLGFVWICLGYRIWVLKERKFPPFMHYLKSVHKSASSALPINTSHLMD